MGGEFCTESPCVPCIFISLTSLALFICPGQEHLEVYIDLIFQIWHLEHAPVIWSILSQSASTVPFHVLF